MARIEFHKNRVLAVVESIGDNWADIYAKKIKDDARVRLSAGAKHPTGHLAREIDVFVSRFTGGGRIVQAQGPRNWSTPYHASFVELGTHKMAAIPFLRPALKARKKRALRDLEARLI